MLSSGLRVCLWAWAEPQRGIDPQKKWVSGVTVRADILISGAPYGHPTADFKGERILARVIGLRHRGIHNKRKASSVDHFKLCCNGSWLADL